jgi:hypothetical protein
MQVDKVVYMVGLLEDLQEVVVFHQIVVGYLIVAHEEVKVALLLE